MGRSESAAQHLLGSRTYPFEGIGLEAERPDQAAVRSSKAASAGKHPAVAAAAYHAFAHTALRPACGRMLSKRAHSCLRARTQVAA